MPATVRDQGAADQHRSERTAVFHPGDRIAQLVIQRYVEARFIRPRHLPGSDRAERGFGSTGVAS